jgi:hypothetical protein
MAAPHRDIDLVERGYRHVASTGIFRVAAAGDRLVSLACAIVRDSHWFLSGFWTDPTRRLSGVGGPLLREVWDEGRRHGTRRHYVWASIDHAALASYMKIGMLPGTQLLAFAGRPRQGLPPGGAPTSRAVPLELRALERIAPLDRAAVGVRRDDDHRYWLEREGSHGVIVTIRGEDVGYYHVHRGTVGPIAWARDDVADLVLWHALTHAATDSPEVQITVPGSNHLALRYALGSGLRLIRQSHLLWTEPVGAMERYVPSGPLLF